ncbi:MAG: phosphatase PAP2-related protein [Patescibacteria group bacterium]
MQADVTLKDIFSRERLPSLLSALALLGASYAVEHFANVYAFDYSQRPTSNYVGDLILDNIPVVDLSFIIIEIALIAIVLGTLFVISKPRYLLFTLKAIALFIIIRAVFISLTHVGIHPENIEPGLGLFDSIYTYLNFQTGLFFSGHAGMPFLVALIFWNNKRVRYILLSLSFIFAVAVLLAHIHYSIDVLAAPFMAYGIFKIAMYLFPQDYKLIEPTQKV